MNIIATHTYTHIHKVNRGMVLVFWFTTCFNQSACINSERDQEREKKKKNLITGMTLIILGFPGCPDTQVLIVYRQTLHHQLTKIDSYPSYWWWSYLFRETLLPWLVGKINLRITESILHFIFPAHSLFIADPIYNVSQPVSNSEEESGEAKGLGRSHSSPRK